MPDLVLKDGREIEIDLYEISIGEWRALLRPEQSDEDEYATLAKITGLTAKEVEDIKKPDYSLLIQAIVAKAANPVSDPNS
jgi:hypothetical protein